MKKEDRKQLYKMLKTWTRAEIVARAGGINGPHQIAFQEKLNMEDAIRVLLYDSCDLVELGLKWKLIKPYSKKRKKLHKERKKANEKAKNELLDFFGGEPIKKRRTK